jgi:putative SOS response-associated peptidase YedK
MTWGFPLALKGKSGQALKPKPVNNAREDKLGTAFWRASFERRRCLIPVSAWAEAEGAKGAMTRTWYSLAGEDVFAVAGIWRPTEEWGHAYSMVMVDGCAQMADVHDRMPVVLARMTGSSGWRAHRPGLSRSARHAQANLRSSAPPSAGRPAGAEREGRGA